ncbi:hypothetical protein ES703_11738 [subsurface metagenome]|nr:hypothetical protein [bacterium]
MARIVEVYKGQKIRRSGKLFFRVYYADGKQSQRVLSLKAARVLIDSRDRKMTPEEWKTVYQEILEG